MLTGCLPSIAATIRPSPGSRRSEFAPHPPISLDVEDFFDICARSGITSDWWETHCSVKDGAGFR